MHRSLVEAQRGICRNEAGKIVLTPEQKFARRLVLLAKYQDCLSRARNCQAQIAEYEHDLGMKPTFAPTWLERLRAFVNKLFGWKN